ncbi:MAG: valine--tRNA ligase [Candidatus Bathyarchaeota archaeon]|nr:MAG: valine--tRNA ligase [Candidatus Bathyarchaeota archaeon]
MYTEGLVRRLKELPKEFKVLEIEEKWQKRWEEMGIHRFNWKDRKRPAYVIDTPPPYPSGDFHVGNVLNWTYFDIIARYKRMRGYNVLFPQGWDCHGLPTEVETEKEHNIKKREVPPDHFVKLCEQLTSKYIDIMKDSIKRLAISVDWTTEYKTMDPDFWRRTQLSFILLYKKDLIYQGTYPINWCPRCETAIADAEVQHQTKQGTLHYIKFPLEDGEHLTVATTRPELLPACVTVAVNPRDPRYKQQVGKTITVPAADRTVTIITDDLVDQKFGTGVVMICTYGDKADVKCVQKHKLPVVMVINQKGEMNKNAGKYAGLTTQQAKKTVTEDLEKSGSIEKTEPIQQEVGVCWRCDTPIEILEQKQWFMKTRVLTPLVEKNTLEITWYPDYMKKRLIDWAKSLDWDWVISRQRIFATPIPIWYCKKCEHVILAKSDWIPIDPRTEPPKTDKCPECGSTNFKPETDVLDTWFDSSISCAVHAGWPDKKDWQTRFPADLHPSGYDIIRTWAYYLMVRHLALFNEKPYRSCLINGMVLGTDGRMMHKSLGNYVPAPDVLDKYGADAARQWAATGGATGSDIPFRWPDVEYAWRFLIKLWNATRFAGLNLQDYAVTKKEVQLELLDKWLLSKLERVTQKATEALETCQFNIAMEEVRDFTWHQLCDCYIEAIKHRLYRREIYGEEKRRAAQYTLYTAVYRILQLLAPISPHIAEEIYQLMYVEDKKHESIHISSWPTPQKTYEEAEKNCELLVSVIGEIRREKSEKRLPLNTPIKKLTVYAGNRKSAHILEQVVEDIAGTCKTEELIILPEKGEGREVQGHSNIHYKADY